MKHEHPDFPDLVVIEGVDMTDIEIDKALALAIGWERQHFMPNTDALFVLQYGMWHFFSHKDWNVIGPIGERYNCFPFEDAFGRWFSDVGTNGKKVGSYTPQKAIALAVINGAKNNT